eukprot:g21964.t1
MSRCGNALWMLVAGIVAVGSAGIAAADDAERTANVLRKNNHVTIVGNALADRMQHHGWLETALQQRFPEYQLSFRNLGFSADELTERLRSAGFGSPDEWLSRTRTDVVFAFFGYNESFAGKTGLVKFEADLTDFIRHTRGQKYNGKTPARLVLFSPIAFENLRDPNLPNGDEHNARIEAYTKAMARVAKLEKVPFVDLYSISKRLYARSKQPLTINGIHLSDYGNRMLGEAIAKAMYPDRKVASTKPSYVKTLNDAVRDKNFHWFQRYRTTDGYNVHGGRSRLSYPDKTTGRKISNFEICQREMAILDVMAANRDKVIWAAARGNSIRPNDANTPPFIPITSNKPGPLPDGTHKFLSGEEAISKMTIAKGLKVNLFASEEMFPELVSPVQMSFDTQGRLWVAVWPSYPHWTPKDKMDDKLLVLEDTDGDGKADKCTTFAGGLHNPTGFEFWNGGVLVAMTPDLLFLKDTDGDGKADVRKRVLHGLGSADTHHAANSFVLSPGGALFFQEGTFHRTQVETVHGPVRNRDGCVWRFNPRTWKVDRYIPYNFANPHGHVFDRWGQDFVHDGTGAVPYHAPLFSGHIDYPQKHARPPQLYRQRTRPCGGTEILSSAHFPARNQGNLLVANVIGFQGIQQYKFEDKGSSFGATEIEPLLQSSDLNFRPVDLETGPDGAVYFVDWQNPIIGHMQHHIRDPNRDKEHGRIYRISYEGRPLLKPRKIAGQPIPVLLDLLKDRNDRVRYRVRIELSGRKTGDVIAALGTWLDTLDTKDPEYIHHTLEALWVQQHHNAVNGALLRKLLRSKDYRARAAATRVLCYSRDSIADPLDLLMVQANDEHPRVRLEAVRAASFFREAKAAEVALAILKHPTDQYLTFTLGETMKQLQPIWKEAIASGASLAADNPAGVNYLLGNVSNAELTKLPRTPMVYQALLTRPRVLHDYRHEAVMALAKINKTDMTTELLAGMSRLDRSDIPEAQSVLFDLAHMLIKQPKSAFNKYRSRIEQLAKTARRPITRRVAYVTLITADGSVEPVWKLASAAVPTLKDAVESAPLLSDAKLRAAMHPKIAPLLKGLPEPLATKVAGRKGTVGRYVRIELPGRRRTLTLAEVEVFSDGRNVARAASARQSSTSHGGVAKRAIDGNKNGAYAGGGQTHTTENRRDPWWEVDLKEEYPIESIAVWNRSEANGRFVSRLNNFTVKILDANRRPVFTRSRIRAPRENITFELQGDPAGAIQRAAINAITYTGVDETGTFKTLAEFVVNNNARTDAVRAISRIPRSSWPEGAAQPLLENIIKHVGTIPAKQRTSPAVLDELALGNRLSLALPKKLAISTRKTLRELGVNVIRLRPVPHRMQYDRSQIFIEAGKPVEIVFENIDIMPHNFVITKPGKLAAVGIAAEKMAGKPEAFRLQFVPQTGDVIVATKMLQPSETARLSFTAPKAVGEYPFVCTFPGHWRRMYGTVHVVKSLDDVPPEVLAPKSDPKIQTRPFVRAWKFDDLSNALQQVSKGRSFEKGRTLFSAISCVQCHRMNGKGGQVGPDLVDVKKKLSTSKFNRADVLREMLEPSKVIDKKYQTVIIVDVKGKVHTGLVLERTKTSVKLVSNPLDKKPPVTIAVDDIDEEYPSKISLMPMGLLNTLTKEEILDLLAYAVPAQTALPGAEPMKILTACCVAVAVCATTPASAQEPVQLKGNPLKGVIDFHVHSGPDSFTRSLTDVEIARVAKKRGMGALVLKNHFTMTADRAFLAERITGMKCFGGIVLNRAVGGLNAAAVERMVTFTGNRGKVVWLPTFDAENHVRHFGEKRESIAVVKDGKPVAALRPIFQLIAKHDLVLATGHSSAAECLTLIRAARAAGVKKILITHAMADPVGMTLDEMKQAARLGAVMECVWLTSLSGPKSHLPNMRLWKRVTVADYAKAFKAVGAKHFILASDLGQPINSAVKPITVATSAVGSIERDDHDSSPPRIQNPPISIEPRLEQTMPDTTVVLRIGPSKPDSNDSPAQSIVPEIDVRGTDFLHTPGKTLNQQFAELADAVEWVIVVANNTTLGSNAVEAIQSEIANAEPAARSIVASSADAVPFDRWSTFPLPAAALIPGCGTPLIVAIRRDLKEQFNEVSDPVRDLVIRSAMANCLAVATFRADHNDVVSGDGFPALHPEHPGNACGWLAAHLEQVADDELFPRIDSAADAVAFRAGLWQMNDYLDTSHEHSQSVEGKGRHSCGDYWHAIMHRREPDPSNSKYWYRRVGDHAVFPALAGHATSILDASSSTTAASWKPKLVSGGNWDPFAFVDFCEEAARSSDQQFVSTAGRIQWMEMMLLLEATYRDATG